MSFPRYPKFKPRGVEWWGDIPKDWGILPAKRSFARRKELNLGMKCDNRLSLTLGGVIPRDLADLDGLQASEFETYQIFCADDLVFKLIDLQNIKTSRVGLVPETGIMSPAYIRIEPNKTKAAPRFACWFFTNLYNRCIFNELGGGVRQTISSEELLLLPYPAIPLQEQGCIAAFLDRETGKIDELVAEQRRLMELLKEKRQAVISHAVTRGLNPQAPLKPSGIEWLGDIPRHWSVVPVAYRYSVQLGKMLDTTKITGEHLRPYLRVFDVQWGAINTEELPQMDFEPEARIKFRLSPGGLLVNEGGSYPGRCAIWAGEIGECYYQKALHRMRAHRPEENCIRFFYFLMSWAANKGVFTAGGNEATIEHLPAEKLRRYRFAFPPITEQTAIAAFLDAETAKLDTLTAEAQRAIDLLQERRTALISAAVTGQIDVRSLGGA